MTTPASTPKRRTRRREPPFGQVGEEPDPRFTLADERAFLAWMRTSLALLAAGRAIVVRPLRDRDRRSGPAIAMSG